MRQGQGRAVRPADEGASAARIVGPPPDLLPVADWERAYRENLDWVYRLVYGRVGNRPDAEDLTSDVFTRALPRLKMGVAPEQLRAYLALTARTTIADYWRRQYDVEVDFDRWESEIGRGEGAEPGSSDNARRAHRLLARLPERYRVVLELRFLRGYSLGETARALGISVANAKVLQHRALRRAAQLQTEAPR